jgi:transposase
MIVLGADTHKRSHTIVAVAAATGELVGEQTVAVGERGFDALLRWARGVDGERVWALEDCRHVSGSLERFLIGRGERVLRIPTHLTAKARTSARQRGKSDPIDALAVARAALQEGLESFPVAHLDGPQLDLRLLVDHRERLVRQRVGLNSTLQWHLHDLWPELELPGSALFYGRWTPRVARRLARAEQTMRVPLARDELRRIRELSQTIKALEAEIAGLVATIAPHLLSEPVFGPLTAAKLVARSPARSASPPQPSWRAPPGSRRSPPAPATPDDNASTKAATARSTPRCTASSSPAPAATPQPRTTSPVAAPKAKPPAKPSAASSATSPATSGDSSSRPIATKRHRHHHQFLDIEATQAVAQLYGPVTVTRAQMPGRGYRLSASNRTAARLAPTRSPSLVASPSSTSTRRT